MKVLRCILSSRLSVGMTETECQQFVSLQSEISVVFYAHFLPNLLLFWNRIGKLEARTEGLNTDGKQTFIYIVCASCLFEATSISPHFLELLRLCKRAKLCVTNLRKTCGKKRGRSNAKFVAQ